MTSEKIITTIEEKSAKHPCFNFGAKHKYGRVHLPVAPKCNMQCNYCNRKFDCVNESRPGVTSTVLSPHQALDYLKKVKENDDQILVAGIAGPGDPFANPEETMETIRLISREFPEMMTCISTNGLAIAPHIDELVALGATHFTITVNAIDPVILAEIYGWIRYNKRIYRGLKAGNLLHEKQMEAITLLKKKRVTVKINSVVLPGINDNHIAEIAKKVASLGANMLNPIPVIPNKNTFFQDIAKPSSREMADIRHKAKAFLPQMSHCARCRSDAVGLIGHDSRAYYKMMKESANIPLNGYEKRPYVAVASREGLLVNMHLGEAKELEIYEHKNGKYEWVETRETPPGGMGDNRWKTMSKTLNDCKALLISGVGVKPKTLLTKSGIKVIEMNGLIEEGLDAVFKGAKLMSVKKTAFSCGTECSGSGGGCG